FEEEQLDREFVLPSLERASELEERGGGRGAIAGTHEAEIGRAFRIEMAGEDEASAAPPRDRADDVGHHHLAERRARHEDLLPSLDTRRLELREDVLTALVQR